MSEYSGRTTCYEHKHGDSWKKTPGAGSDCIQQVILFDVQWSNCPIEVEEEVKKLWREEDFGNDCFYYKWNSEMDRALYPIIDSYLTSRGVEKCLIRWWW